MEWKDIGVVFSIVFSVLSLIVSIGFSAYTFSAMKDLTLQGHLRGQMLAYAEKYEKILTEFDDPFSIAGYGRLLKKNKERVRIIHGMLAGVVDLMNESNDPRADTWSAYIANIQGPLSDGYPLEVWVRNKKTIDAIAKAKNQIGEMGAASQ
jgi:hypothetical protein